MSKFDKETRRNEFFNQRDHELDKNIDPATGKIFSHLTEEIKCPLCNCERYSQVLEKNGFTFARCKNCSFVYVNPRIKEGDIIKYYKNDDASNELAANMTVTETQLKFNDNLYRNYFFKRIKEKIPMGGRVLDIGCGSGQFLNVAKDFGYEVLGLELNERYLKYAEENYNIKIERKLLHECNFPDNSFDVVSMFGVIEHLTDPAGVMKDVARILRPGGLFVGVCPNVEGLVCAVLHEQSRTFTGRNHLSYFSERTLRYLFNKVGLKTQTVDTSVSGKDSLLNYFQFIEPFADEEYAFLPEKFREFILNEENFKLLEEKMNELGLGYKLRFFAEK